jgi:rhodanese-related sulfurtransferase
MKSLTAKELKEALSNDQFIIVDVRERSLYNEKHLPGAMSIPIDEFDTSATKALGKDEPIVVYGDSFHSSDAQQAVQKLAWMGYNAIFMLEGGREAWENEQYTFEMY